MLLVIGFTGLGFKLPTLCSYPFGHYFMGPSLGTHWAASWRAPSFDWLVVGMLHPGNIYSHITHGYQLVTMHTHGDFSSASQYSVKLSRHTANQSFPILLIPGRKRHISIWWANFISWQHLRSYQHGYQPVTVHTRGAFSSAVPVGNQAASTMTRYPTQSNYPDTELTSHSLSY